VYFVREARTQAQATRIVSIARQDRRADAGTETARRQIGCRRLHVVQSMLQRYRLEDTVVEDSGQIASTLPPGIPTGGHI
jgi:hypothetical protein